MYRLLGALCLIVVVSSTAPEGFILNIEPTCGTNTSVTASINVKSDVDGVVYLVCKDDFALKLPLSDEVNHIGEIKYDGNPKTECVFKKREHSNVYIVDVEVSYGEAGSNLQTYEDNYRVICVHDKYRNVESSSRDSDEGYTAPLEVQRHSGGLAQSTFDLYATNIVGKRLTANVAIGRKIRLQADMTPAGGEKGFMVASCIAFSGDKKYQIIRAGCGDGVVFNKAIGFTTTGTTAKSPYFNAFRLTDSFNINFACNFSTCTDTCEGNACHLVASRKKRSANTVPQTDMYRTVTSVLHLKKATGKNNRLLLDESSVIPGHVNTKISKQSDDELSAPTAIVETVFVRKLNPSRGDKDANLKKTKHSDKGADRRSLTPLKVSSLITLGLAFLFAVLVIGCFMKFKKSTDGEEAHLLDRSARCHDCRCPAEVCTCRGKMSIYCLVCQEPLLACSCVGGDKPSCPVCTRPLPICACELPGISPCDVIDTGENPEV